ncbi:MAG: 23S rRNA (pseudouridine(1915)-N(3))-methyltransferase RlmH [Wenzhouxiangellaceae bacterium]|nr:23S rRNA (pseudouridine(1915)-N(3))-methyltransferase RlmH [Wenzhouxiangellaceae bacterium]MBS3745582.1 23S rRNA (pseudouridine(1915)-N(3))-methyltransferase RlmH [Wenzhouxiangellaceae bacterium]MBS3822929.1 23S rRNA (pseudouridine(1915)-N(3))-methyltransferase RlmH [Wenzhouxiangellaceae bacterium]
MQIRLIAIGRSMPDWIARGWHEYARRMPPAIDLELIEVVPPRATGGDERRREGDALLARCPASGVRIALDERGAAWSTRELAQRMDDWLMQGESVSLLIGGAAGHSPELAAQCSARWSLSALTFPHMLVRVIVAEQLYRAWTVLSGHPYHRG